VGYFEYEYFKFALLQGTGIVLLFGNDYIRIGPKLGHRRVILETGVLSEI